MTDALIAAALTLAQAALVSPMLSGPYTKWRQSIEAAFITDARFIAERFPDISWAPFWYMGFPFELFYTPLLQTATALLGSWSGDIPAAYRIVAAIGLSLGAAGAYALARACGGSRAAAVLAAALFSCAPLASYLLPNLWADGSAVTGSAVPLPWRLVVLVEYGEGPHVMGLSLSLFAAAAALAYLGRPTRRRLWSAAILLALVALTNLIAVLGAAVFAAVATLAMAGGRERVRSGLVLAGATALLCLTWYSPGFIRAVAGFSTPGGEGGGPGYLLFPFALVGAAFAGRYAFRAHPGAAMLLGSGIVFAAILASWYLFRAPLAPQPIRYALELDAVVAIGIALALDALVRARGRRVAPLLRDRPAPALLGVAALVLLASLPGWSAIQSRIAPDPDWGEWSERKVATWLRDHLGSDERAFLSGSHSFWLNVFADAPQIRGGVDFAGTTPWWAHATFQITTGSDAQTSALWLRALGARYAVLTGPDSRDMFRDFAKPEMFDGVLPLATAIDGARIYEAPSVFASPRLIEQRADPPPPRDALDRATLERYVGALDAGTPQASLRIQRTGLGSWEGEIDTGGRPLTLLLRTAHDSGWRVRLNDVAATTRPDTIGLLAVDVPTGFWRVRIDHRVHTDLLVTNVLAWGALAVLALRRGLRGVAGWRWAPVATIAATVATLAVALGVVVGYPKGSDAPMHVTRLKYAADWWPSHDWMYVWAAGMPTFDTYPALPYLAAIPFVRAFGAEPVLQLIALLSMLGIGLGLYGHVRERGRPRAEALLTALIAVTSLATWTWIVNGGVYARVVAFGLGAVAWWTHARALRTDGVRWWAATAALLAASVASHQVMGAISALYVAAVHLSARGRPGIPRLAGVAAISLLLAAPALLPTLAGGGGAFLGRVRPDLAPVQPEMLWSPIHVGLAAFTLALAVLVAEIAHRPLRVALAALPLGAVLLYCFAPALGIESSRYYLSGIDPVTMTFLISLVGALTFAALIPHEGPRARPILMVGAVLVVANLAVGVPLFTAQRTYPQVIDTRAPTAREELARRSLAVDGDDVRHRILPFSADESVWFNAEHRKPQLRHYYDQGVVHPDWLAWAFGAVYTPPIDPTRARSVAEWYALDAITIPDGSPAERDLATIPWLRALQTLVATPFHQYNVEDPSSIVVESSAPIVVVVADRFAYDRTARLLFDDAVTPATRVPIWHDGTLADLPSDLRERAAAVLVVGERVGSGGEVVARAVAERGARVVWDLAGVADRDLPEPWPAANVRARAITEWSVRDRSGRIAAGAFSPAVYDGGPWGAQVTPTLRGGARAELVLGDAPLIASAQVGRGELVTIGGNLPFHALVYANAAERAYVTSFLGPAARDADVEPAWTFDHPGQRTVPTSGGTVVVKESFHPGWSATWRGPDGREEALPVRYTGPGLMAALAPGVGTVTLRYGGAPTGPLATFLSISGLFALGWLALGRRWPRLPGR